MSEGPFAADKAELPAEWHETFDALTAQGRAPSSIKATIEYVTTQKTQEACAEEFSTSDCAIRDLQSAVIELGPADGVTKSVGRRQSLETEDYCERIADKLAWEEGVEYSMNDTTTPTIRKAGWRSLHRAIVANTEVAMSEDTTTVECHYTEGDALHPPLGGEDTTVVECHRCGYLWDYGGNLDQATCPSCQRKTPVEGDGNDA
jgi:hypothetical protein